MDMRCVRLVLGVDMFSSGVGMRMVARRALSIEVSRCTAEDLVLCAWPTSVDVRLHCIITADYNGWVCDVTGYLGLLDDERPSLTWSEERIFSRELHQQVHMLAGSTRDQSPNIDCACD